MYKAGVGGKFPLLSLSTHWKTLLLERESSTLLSINGLCTYVRVEELWRERRERKVEEEKCSLTGKDS